MEELNTQRKTKQDRSSVTAFIATPTREALLQIAANKDLTLSDILRAACNEYVENHNTPNGAR